jgi:hypothetical protein
MSLKSYRIPGKIAGAARLFLRFLKESPQVAVAVAAA